MSSVVQKQKLLIVDTSPSMAQVLSTYAMFEEYPADTLSDPADACIALDNLNVTGQSPYQCVVLGWPEGKISIIADLLQKLSEAEHSNLPLIIVSQEDSAVTKALAARRPNTQVLLWKDYQLLNLLIEKPVDTDMTERVTAAPQAVRPMAPQTAQQAARQVSRNILFVSNAPYQYGELTDLLKGKNYHVTSVRTASQAKSVLRDQQFDFLISDFYLKGESSEELCAYVTQMDEAPVFALMTDKNLAEVVQRSLKAGAVTCINKAEPVDSLFPRLDAIINGLPARHILSQEATADVSAEMQVALPNTIESVPKVDVAVPASSFSVSTLGSAVPETVSAVPAADVALPKPVLQQPAPIDQVLVPLAGLLELADKPSVLLDSRQRIVAASQKAQNMLSPQAPEKLLDDVSLSSLTGLDLTQQSGSARLSSITGDDFEVEFQTRKLAGKTVGASEDYDHLTFKVVRKYPAAAQPIVDTSSAITSLPPLPLPAVETIEEPTPTVGTQRELERSMGEVLQNRRADQVVSILVIDIKMIATVTGDRLGLGQSEPLLNVVKEKLADQYPRDNALSYLEDGRFALLLETQRVEQALNLSKKVIDSIPTLISDLAGIDLVSHAAFLRIPDHSSIAPDYLLKHCVAACLKTELDGRDNSIYVIGKEPWQRIARKSTASASPVTLPVERRSAESGDRVASM